MRIIASLLVALSICVPPEAALAPPDGAVIASRESYGPFVLRAASAATAKQMPTDDCGRDRSFATFRSHFGSIVKKRDFHALVELLAPDAEYFAAGAIVPTDQLGGGKEGFRRKFKDGRDPALWKNLKLNLKLGCSDVGDSKIIPSVPDGLELDQYLVVIPSSPLLQRPSNKSRVMARLSWDIITNIGEDPPSAFVHVRLADGRTGYVRRDQLRNEYEDDHLLFEKRHGRWMLASFHPDEP